VSRRAFLLATLSDQKFVGVIDTEQAESTETIRPRGTETQRILCVSVSPWLIYLCDLMPAL